MKLAALKKRLRQAGAVEICEGSNHSKWKSRTGQMFMVQRHNRDYSPEWVKYLERLARR